MSDPPAAKRARANTAGEANNTTASDPSMDYGEFLRILPTLSLEDSHKILREAAKIPAVGKIIHALVTEKREKERNKVRNFDNESRYVWKEINVTYSRMSGSKQYDMSGRVDGSIRESVDNIVEACGPFASSDTRYNGLSALRKIGKSICLSDGVIGHEIRNNSAFPIMHVQEAMLKILNEMEPDELADIRYDDGSPEGLWSKLLELDQLAQENCMFDDLGEVLDILREAEESDPEDQEEDEDGHQEEDEDPANDHFVDDHFNNH